MLYKFWKWGDPRQLAFNLFGQLFWMIFNIRKVDFILISFAGYLSVIPVFLGKLFNKPVFIILNGTECVSFPSFKYGLLRKKLPFLAVSYSLHNASKLFPVSKSLVYSENLFISDMISKQGVKYFFPNIKTLIEVISNGFDLEKWSFTPQRRIENSFITVGPIDNMTRFSIKGIDLILEAARTSLHASFLIVGVKEGLLTDVDIPDNVKIVGLVKPEELKNLFVRHQYYLQLSINEGFGCALAEAMLCGCVPIGSKAGNIPELVDGIGYILNKRSPDELINVLSEAMQIGSSDYNEKSRLAIERIRDYSMENRVMKLKSAILGSASC